MVPFCHNSIFGISFSSKVNKSYKSYYSVWHIHISQGLFDNIYNSGLVMKFYNLVQEDQQGNGSRCKILKSMPIQQVRTNKKGTQ